MRSNTTFTYAELPSGNDNTIKVELYVDDDNVTDQDVLAEIQTQSIYKQQRLLQLDELEPGVWTAVFGR